MGGAGMFAVSVYMIFMGGFYDRLVAAKVPAGTSDADMANVLVQAKKSAGPEIINATLIIPLVLIIAFAGLNIYMRRKKVATA